jgi:hypothetical protein
MIKLKSLISEDKVSGGLSDNMSLSDIAKKHNVSVEELNKEFEMGMKVEMEHTTDKEIAKEIAKDHLFEDPKYYTKLATIETNEDLRNWFKSKWVNIGKKVDGKHPPCGTSGEKSGYAKCVPASKAATMSKKEKESATRRKRAAQNKANRGGVDSPGQGKKPINVSTHPYGKKSGTGKGS